MSPYLLEAQSRARLAEMQAAMAHFRRELDGIKQLAVQAQAEEKSQDKLATLTPEERGFVRALLKAPTDRTLLAIFADYLEEKGRKESVRIRALADGKGKAPAQATAGNLLDFPVPLQVFNRLEEGGIHSIAELCTRTAGQLLALRGFGVWSLACVQDALAARGLTLRQPGE